MTEYLVLWILPLLIMFVFVGEGCFLIGVNFAQDGKAASAALAFFYTAVCMGAIVFFCVFIGEERARVSGSVYELEGLYSFLLVILLGSRMFRTFLRAVVKGQREFLYARTNPPAPGDLEQLETLERSLAMLG